MIPKLIRKREASYQGRNITRCYYIVNPRGDGEARVDVWAVKNDPRKRLVAKKVAKYYTDKNEYHVRYTMRSCTYNYLTINWSEQDWGVKHQAVWSDVDSACRSWGKVDYRFNRTSEQVFLRGEWLNGWEGTRYERCGDENSYLHFKQYLECWNLSHATEFLAKADLNHFITPLFVKKLRDDKAFFNYFRSSIKQIRQGYYGRGAVLRSFRTGETFVESDWMLKNLMYLMPYSKRIPKAVDRKGLFRWMEKTGIEPWTYAEYCDHVAECGLDIRGHGLMFPIERTMDRVNELCQAKKMREQRKLDEKRLKELERIAEAIKRMECKTYLGGLSVVFPKSNEEYVTEGNLMDNCIGSYYTFDDKDNIIGFIRKNGKPYVDFRIDGSTFKVMEARYKHNLNALNSTNVKNIVTSVANELKNESKERMVA